MKTTLLALLITVSQLMMVATATTANENLNVYSNNTLLQLVKNPARCQECKNTWQSCRANCDSALNNCPLPQSMCENLWSRCMAENCDPRYNACFVANC